MGSSAEGFYERELARALDERLEVYAVLLDEEGRVKKANAFARQVSGDEIEGRAFKELVVDFHREFRLQDFAGTGEVGQRLTLSSGKGLPKTLYFTGLREHGYTLLIGERNNEDADMLRKNLLDTNTELSNLTRKFQKANAELTRLNEQKNKFLGIAAHDLRNPLASILAYCDFLLEDTELEDEESVAFIGNIKTSSRYMLNLLEDLLDLTRIEAGKLDLDLMEISMRDLLKKNLELNRPIAERKKISLACQCHEEVPPLLIDPMKIEQVLNNIISNAIKYSQPGTRIEVSMFRTGDFVTVGVKDEGIGIPAKDLDKVFQPFARLKKAGTAGESSTGLGLAIVQKIVTGHKGRIWVESEEEKGTTFYFTLPVSLPLSR